MACFKGFTKKEIHRQLVTYFDSGQSWPDREYHYIRCCDS